MTLHAGAVTFRLEDRLDYCLLMKRYELQVHVGHQFYAHACTIVFNYQLNVVLLVLEVSLML